MPHRTVYFAPNLRHLYAYLVENRLIESVREYDERCLKVFSRDVLKKLRAGEPGWEPMVPAEVSELIKRRGLLGYGTDARNNEAA